MSGLWHVPCDIIYTPLPKWICYYIRRLQIAHKAGETITWRRCKDGALWRRPITIYYISYDAVWKKSLKTLFVLSQHRLCYCMALLQHLIVRAPSSTQE
jgi:hypothetical protein